MIIEQHNKKAYNCQDWRVHKRGSIVESHSLQNRNLGPRGALVSWLGPSHTRWCWQDGMRHNFDAQKLRLTIDLRCVRAQKCLVVIIRDGHYLSNNPG